MEERIANALLRRIEALERSEAASPPQARASIIRSGKVIAVLAGGRANVREVSPTGDLGRTWIGLRVPGSGAVSEGQQVELAWSSYDPIPRILAGSGGGGGGGEGWTTVRSFDFQTLIFGS